MQKSEGRAGTWWEQQSLRWTLICDSAQLWPSLIRHRTGLGIQPSSPLFSQFSQAASYLKVLIAHTIAYSAGVAASWVLPSPGSAFGLFSVGAPGTICEGRCVIWLPQGDGRKFSSMSRSFYLPAVLGTVQPLPSSCVAGHLYYGQWEKNNNTCYYRILLPRVVDEGAGICNSLVWAAGWSSALGAPRA